MRGKRYDAIRPTIIGAGRPGVALKNLRRLLLLP